MNQLDDDRPEPIPQTVAGWLSMFIESAIEALVQAWLILLLGGIAFGIVSGVFEQMLPSPPPGFSHPTHAESGSALEGLWDSGRLAFGHHRLLLLWVPVFALMVWSRATQTAEGQSAGKQSRMRRAWDRLSDDWFSLLVFNAFGAMVSAWVLVWAQFSVERWLLMDILGWIGSGIWHWVEPWLGPAHGSAVQNWWHWYGENQLRFTFWVLYIGAICDDLGLPNFKTLGRWLWRKVKRSSLLHFHNPEKCGAPNLDRASDSDL